MVGNSFDGSGNWKMRRLLRVHVLLQPWFLLRRFILLNDPPSP